MLSKLTLKKSKQTEKLKVITFFSVAHFGLLLPKTRLILAPIWPFLKNFWFRFRLLKDNSMMMINSTDFASNLQKNRKMWTISYLLRWINNYRVLLLVYLGTMYVVLNKRVGRTFSWNLMSSFWKSIPYWWNLIIGRVGWKNFQKGIRVLLLYSQLESKKKARW